MQAAPHMERPTGQVTVVPPVPTIPPELPLLPPEPPVEVLPGPSPALEQLAMTNKTPLMPKKPN